MRSYTNIPLGTKDRSGQVEAWKTRPEQLTCRRVGDSLVVSDSRAIAVASRTSLRGIRKALLEYCDKAQTIVMLEKQLRTENINGTVTAVEIQRILEEFVGNKLMIKE